jgi:peptide/nickel transport system ATP-binding protein
MEPILHVEGLEVVYHTHVGPLKALHDVSFDVQPGEMLALVGESGCGKSTVASSLLHLLPPNGEITAGTMVFRGQDLRTLDTAAFRELRGTEMAMIFQDPTTSLNPVFTVGTQMHDIRRAHPEQLEGGQKELRNQIVAMLEQVGIPDAEERVDQFPHEFSGGMRQRIMIAMALMSKPGLLIADEPTSSLDVTMEAQIVELIQILRQQYDTSLLFISHDLGVVAQLCERVAVMYAGRIVEQGDVFSIFDDPQHPYTQALLASVPSRHTRGHRLATIPGVVPSLLNLPRGCKFSDRCAYVQPVCEEREPDFEGVAGRGVRCHRYSPGSGYAIATVTPTAGEVSPDTRGVAQSGATPRPEGTQPDVLLEVRNLSTHFVEDRNIFERVLRRPIQAVRAVNDVSLQIERGETLGLVGESGCGKTTLSRTVLGLQPATAGQIVYEGRDISTIPRAELRRLRSRIQMIFQDPYSGLSPRLTVSYLLTEAYKIHRVPKEERYSVGQLLSMVGLSEELANKYAHEMSGGQARRVGIARAISLHPDFLIADEPTSGLDVSVAASILNLLKDLADRLGLTYMVITHNLNLVGYIADRVAVMYLGRLVELGPTERIFEAPAHPYTQALLSAVSEPDPRQRREGRRLLLKGEIPSPKNPPPGCCFSSRCSRCTDNCDEAMPELLEIEPEHLVACTHWHEVQGELLAEKTA